jgi:hypothetical protein
VTPPLFAPPPRQLIVPSHVTRDLQEQTREYAAQLWQLFDFDDPICKKWNPELEKIDPRIKLGRAKPLAHLPGYPVKAGYYHFLRDNPGAPPTCDTITGPDGESFAEPDSSVLEKIRSNDLLDPRVVVTMEAAREREQEQEAYERAQRRDERQAEIYERYVAGNRAFVSLSDATGWTQSAKGKRAAKK